MATVTIPIALNTAAAPLQASVTIDGTDYLLTIAYSQRDAAWYLSVADSSGALLVGSQPLIESWPLLSPHKRTNAAIPQGDLFLAGQSLVYVEAA